MFNHEISLSIIIDYFYQSYTAEPPKDSKYGAKVNGTWNGMIGTLVSNNADMAVGDISVNYDRWKVVHFLTTYYEDGYSILIPPPMEEVRIFACTKPFELKVT